MLYKFESRATAPMIMLERDAQKILKIIGKAPSPSGIITAEQIPSAIAALRTAMEAEEASTKEPPPSDEQDEDEQEDVKATIGLKQRAIPLIDMLQRSAAEDMDVVWGG